MFKRLAAAFVVACSVWPVSGPYAADFHVSQYSFGARAWQGLPLIERLELLTKEGLYVFIKGPITQGDHATLVRIHALVPVHTLMISSPGGSVAEALKIADPKGLIKWLGKDRALVTLGAGRDIPANRAAFEAIVRAWLKVL